MLCSQLLEHIAEGIALRMIIRKGEQRRRGDTGRKGVLFCYIPHFLLVIFLMEFIAYLILDHRAGSARNGSDGLRAFTGHLGAFTFGVELTLEAP